MKKKRKKKQPKMRNPYVEEAINRKGGPMKDRREKRIKDKLRRQQEDEYYDEFSEMP